MARLSSPWTSLKFIWVLFVTKLTFRWSVCRVKHFLSPVAEFAQRKLLVWRGFWSSASLRLMSVKRFPGGFRSVECCCITWNTGCVSFRSNESLLAMSTDNVLQAATMFMLNSVNPVGCHGWVQVEEELMKIPRIVWKWGSRTWGDEGLTWSIVVVCSLCWDSVQLWVLWV